MKNKAIIVITLILVTSLFIGFTIWNATTFRLTKATPSLTGDVPTSTGTIRLEFNQNIQDIQDLNNSIEGPGLAVVSDIEVEQKNITIHLTPLEEDTNYKFNLKNISSKSGKIIPTIRVDITARYVPYDKLSRDQQQLELQQTDRNNINDPILEHLPYQGDRFYLETELTYSDSGVDVLVINAQLFLTIDEVYRDRNQVLDEYEQRIYGYIKSLNLDPEKYNIRYVVNEPPVRSD